jgi:hypothetical protein
MVDTLKNGIQSIEIIFKPETTSLEKKLIAARLNAILEKDFWYISVIIHDTIKADLEAERLQYPRPDALSCVEGTQE